MLTPNPVQTAYQRYINIGMVGMPATTYGWDISTRLAEDLSGSNAGLGFGLVVSQGTKHGDRSVTLGTLSGGTVIGITAADKTLPVGAAAVIDRYADGDNTAVMTRGDIWVQVVSGSVLAGGAVYYNSSTGALGGSGISNATLLKGAQWLTASPVTGLMATPSGTFAVVRLLALGSF